MSEEPYMQEWTQKEIQAAIAKALENEPEGPNKEYWTTPDCTVQDIKEKHGLKRFKPNPMTITLVRECCGAKFAHTLANKKEAKVAEGPQMHGSRMPVAHRSHALRQVRRAYGRPGL